MKEIENGIRITLEEKQLFESFGFKMPNLVTWSTIMPVVHRIDITIKNTSWIRGLWTIQDLPITTPINQVYKYAVDFIKYYNTH